MIPRTQSYFYNKTPDCIIKFQTQNSHCFYVTCNSWSTAAITDCVTPWLIPTWLKNDHKGCLLIPKVYFWFHDKIPNSHNHWSHHPLMTSEGEVQRKMLPIFVNIRCMTAHSTMASKQAALAPQKVPHGENTTISLFETWQSWWCNLCWGWKCNQEEIGPGRMLLSCGQTRDSWRHGGSEALQIATHNNPPFVFAQSY